MITTADVAVALGRPQPDVNSAERLQWDMWIRNARLQLRKGDGTHKGLGDLDLLDQETLDYVLVEAVAAKVKRPDDATQVDISVDDGRVSKLYQSSTGTVFIRPEWWEMLAPTGQTSGAFSTRPSYEPDTCPFPWVSW